MISLINILSVDYAYHFQITEGDPYAYEINESTGRSIVHRLKGCENAIIHKVVRISSKKVLIQFREIRKPAVGDKFSSRHGQKGMEIFHSIIVSQ